MVKLVLEFLEFLRSCAPLLFCLGVIALFFVLTAKSIKKHSTIYYTIFSLPFLLYLIPYLRGLMGIETIDFVRVPIVGEILRDYIHVGALAHPMLIIIMYVGALSPKNPVVKKLLSIRKEISIISGFPILTHSLVRVVNNFPNSLRYFTNNAEYMETARYTNEVGLGISNFSFVLGIVLVIIFIPLWVTSFDWVRKHMSRAGWKKLQKWSYVLYALLFVHAIGIQVGGMLNPRVPASRPIAVAEVPAAGEQTTRSIAQNSDTTRTEQENQTTNKVEREEKTERPATAQQATQGQVSQQPTGGRAPTKGISDIKVSRQTRQCIHIASLILIYGSYLFFRLRKAKRATQNKIRIKSAI